MHELSNKTDLVAIGSMGVGSIIIIIGRTTNVTAMLMNAALFHLQTDTVNENRYAQSLKTCYNKFWTWSLFWTTPHKYVFNVYAPLSRHMMTQNKWFELVSHIQWGNVKSRFIYPIVTCTFFFSTGSSSTTCGGT